MRMCFVAYKYYERTPRLIRFAEVLKRQGWDVNVLCLRRDEQSHFEIINNVKVHRIRIRERNEKTKLDYISKILYFFIRATLILTKGQFCNSHQVICFINPPDFLVFAAIIPKIMGVPIIIDIYDILPEFYACKFKASNHSLLYKLLLWVEKLSIKFSDHVTVANHIWKQRLETRSVVSEKCTAIPYTADPRIYYSRSKKRNDNRFILIYPGTLNWHQGVEIAIRAFAKVVTVIPAVEFHVFGEGPEKTNLMNIVKELRLNKVFFHDMLPVRQIAEEIADSDLVVVPKRASSVFGNEAASTKILECMMIGVPVIAARTKVENYYFNDSLIKYFESENVEDLANSIVLLKNNYQLRQQLKLNATQFIHGNTLLDMETSFLEIVNSLVAK